MKLSVVIVNYNVKYFLEQCLDSVLAATQNISTEVIVVDNLSTDGSVDYLIPKFPQVTFISNTENVGFSRANNQAIKMAQGEYVLLLNPDTVIGERTLENVCRFMDETPQSGGVGVKMIDGYGCFLPESKRGFPSPWNSFCKMSGLSKLVPRSRFFGQYHLRYLNENEIHQVDVLSGAFMMLRKTVLDQIGLLDESFFMYGEDIDLSYRIKQGGFENYYLPERIIHYKGESTKKDFRYVKIFYEAMLIFYKKHYPEACFIHRWLIYLAIYSKAGIDALGKLIFGNKSQKVKRCSEKTFDVGEKTYEEIIAEMDVWWDKDTLFKLYHSDRNMVVAANEILHIKTNN